MKKVLIIGCGILGSSLARRISKKNIAKKTSPKITKTLKIKSFLININFFNEIIFLCNIISLL